MPTPNWSVREWLLVITLIGGFLVFFCGIALMIAGTNAEGIIDLKSSVVSGSIKTGSAGLFVCVFGLSLVITTLVLGLRERVHQPLQTRQSSRESIGKLIIGLGFGFTVCVGIAGLLPSGENTGFVAGAIAFGVLMVPSVLTFLWGEQ